MSARYYCPLPECRWTATEPEPTAEDDAKARDLTRPDNPAADPAGTVTYTMALAFALAADRMLEEHLRTHSLLEWVSAVTKLTRQAAKADTRLGQIVQHAPAILRALRFAEASSPSDVSAAPFREAREAAGWGPPPDRSARITEMLTVLADLDVENGPVSEADKQAVREEWLGS